LENYKANFCIFFNELDIHSKNDSLENKDRFKKLLNAIYVAIKGDIYSSPNFDIHVNISIMDDCYIVLCISGNDQSKFRASILSYLKIIDVVYTTIYTNS
jgi:tRNA threonylcarbamoyladenosine modification (KEOPS) complex  Pcc1 subunit